LSLTVLIYALAQPAIAIIRGNNRLKTQINVAAITAFVVVGGMFLLVPRLGILGAAIALVAGELVDTQLYKIAAKKWLIKNGLEWPIRTSRIAALSVVVSCLTLGCLIYFPGFKLIIIIVSFMVFTTIIVEYYRSFPELIKQRVTVVINNILKR